MAGKLAKFAAQSTQKEDCIEVWEENVQSVNFFLEFCGTQWRVVMGGVTGLDYTAVITSLRTLRLNRERFDEVFADIRTMERAAMEEMQKK